MPSPRGATAAGITAMRVAGAVRGGHGDARAVGREVEVGQRGEVGRVGQQVLEAPAGEVVAVEVEALRAAVVTGEVQVAAVGGEHRRPARVVEVADAARLAALEVQGEDLPVAVAIPLEGERPAVGRDRVRPVVRADRRRRRRVVR